MKVVEVASGDFFSTYGGGQVYVKNIVDEMVRQGRDVAVVSFTGDKGVEHKSYKGIDLVEVGDDGIDELQKVVARISPDVIHAHSHKAQMVEIGCKLGIPVVVTSHHGGIVCPAGTLMDCSDHTCQVAVNHHNCLRCVLRNIRSGLIAYPLMRLLPRKAYIRLGRLLGKLPFIYYATPIGNAARQIADKQREWQTIIDGCRLMIAPCRELAIAMERNGLSHEKVKILPHGIPLPIGVPPFPSIVDGNVKFFHVGRICYVKGLHVLLEAFHRTRAPRAEMHLIGGAGNKEEQRYEAMLRHRYADDTRIIWHGKIPPEEVYKTIANMHISCSSSYLEAYGLNIAESLAMGKPVLATRNGGAEMQVEDGVNGWLVPQNDVEAMREKMQWIVDNLHDYDTRRSTERVISIERHCQELWKIYSEVTVKA